MENNKINIAEKLKDCPMGMKLYSPLFGYDNCTDMPFQDGKFRMVVFDPPHLARVGEKSWLCKKYGKLPENWQQFINDSIHECMRVLADFGVLIFKWNEQQIKVNDVLNAITDYRPVFGHRTTIKNNTIWMAFMKMRKGGDK